MQEIAAHSKGGRGAGWLGWREVHPQATAAVDRFLPHRPPYPKELRALAHRLLP